jgi:hypothetical protein
MSITYVQEWLRDAGYEYHCFISYPRISNDDMAECARRVKESIEKELTYLVRKPNIFLDTSIEGGMDWEKRLTSALCHSLTMVALCSPIYYHQEHKWCGLEWAAMDSLAQKRLPGADVRTIIPLIVRISSPLPDPVARIQYIDISRVTIKGRRYYNTQEFRLRIKEVVNTIEKIALTVAQNQVATDCNCFEFPVDSAFADWHPALPSHPFRSNKQ